MFNKIIEFIDGFSKKYLCIYAKFFVNFLLLITNL